MKTLLYVLLVVAASCFPYVWAKWLLRRDRRTGKTPAVHTDPRILAAMELDERPAS